MSFKIVTTTLAFIFLHTALLTAEKKDDPRIGKLPKTTLSKKAIIGNWSFDDASGELTKDSSSAKNDGTIKGKAIWSKEAAPKMKGSLILNGKTYVDACKPEDLNTITTTVTMAAWVKRTQKAKRYACVLSRQIQDSTGEHYGLYFKKGKLGFMFNMHKKGGGALWTKKELPLNEWMHIAAVADGTNITIYVNGKHVAQRQWSGEFSKDFTRMVISGNAGGKQNRVGEFFIGHINNLGIYNYALSPSDISKLATK